MIKVGLTGGIGSGKTYVSKIFESLGIPVFHADHAGHMAYQNGEVRNQVIQLLGIKSYNHEGLPDRRFIASRVFDKAGLLHQLNEIIHPWVHQQFMVWADNLSATPYVIKEAAILFESGSDQQMSHTICVWAPDGLRTSRVQNRDGVSAETVIKRMSHQWPQEKIKQLSTFLVQNDGTKLVLPQVLKIHQKIISQ